MQIHKWLYPGMKVKRWLLLACLGFIFAIIGFAITINFGILSKTEELVMNALKKISISQGWVDLLIYGIIVMVIGIALIIFGIRQVMRSLIAAVAPGTQDKLVDIVHKKCVLEKGPKIVALGGGTGLSTLLRGLKPYTSNITAIVTVADDGGSSGKLRAEWGVLPPGDIRSCLVALADTEPLMEKLFQHRFVDQPGLSGHSFGNLFIATMSAITGDFEEAIKESSKVLAVRGRVIPATLANVKLCAEYEDGRVVEGESLIPEVKAPIKRVYLKPSEVSPIQEAIEAIEKADLIVLGPGSLYTSVLPNLLVRGIPDAIRRSKGLKVYVCNVMTQPGETDGYLASQHVEALIAHAGSGIVEYVLVNDETIPTKLLARYRKEGAEPVLSDIDRIAKSGFHPMSSRILSYGDFARHDPVKLGRAIMELFNVEKRNNSNGIIKNGSFEEQYIITE